MRTNRSSASLRLIKTPLSIVRVVWFVFFFPPVLIKGVFITGKACRVVSLVVINALTLSDDLVIQMVQPFYLSSFFVFGEIKKKKKKENPTGSLSSDHKETTWGLQRKGLGRRRGGAGVSQPRCFSAADVGKGLEMLPASLPASLPPASTGVRPEPALTGAPAAKKLRCARVTANFGERQLCALG